MEHISILGCGWLGLPLAEHLIQKGFSIKGSTTSPNRIGELESKEIEAFIIELSADEISGDYEAFLQNSKTLIIDIPPKLRGENPESFVGKMKTFIQKAVLNSSIEKVLFISSTSVYGDEPINVTEETIEKPETLSGKELLETEHLLHQQTAFKTTILRFGGLIGGSRNPAKSLSGKSNIATPNAPINLIHQDDCIGIITAIIVQNFWGEKINASAPFHPTRKEYYMAKAKELGLPLPEFEENKASGKVIDSSKLISKLNYNFIHVEDI
ncbi:SDR family oxidoreductase [Flavobacterium antarcticum]|uniref:SDR family oxidoreductase n=1 Tax=Flavobacterium antarcticum TaxID=271155 RepID=UPI0003B39398|nr:SDR family oxidoreductase [Flavobacterium antarcticum]